MFVRTKHAEARIADLKEAHAREVKHLKMLADVLAEQVEYLRAQAAQRPFISTKVKGTNPSELATVQPGDLAYMSEEEEDLRALAEFGHISELDLEKALAGLQLRGTVTAEPAPE